MTFAHLELEHGAVQTDYPNELFRQRVTSRLGSNGKRIDHRVSALLRQIEPANGHTYHQLDDPTLIEAIIQENIAAVFHDLNVRAYHDEIVRWFRYSDEQARRQADGLDYRCMRISAAELKLMRSLPQIMRWPISRGIVRWNYRRQLGGVSHLGVLSGPFFDDAASIRAGAYLMRFWLELARHELYIHPFGNLVTNPAAHARMRDLTGIDHIWLVFRIGHTDAPPRSYRRSLPEVLVHD
ncbi:MAG: hypothetical protein ABIP55_09620 [Tepidisphaeraceae bacterium]